MKTCKCPKKYYEPLLEYCNKCKTFGYIEMYDKLSPKQQQLYKDAIEHKTFNNIVNVRRLLDIPIVKKGIDKLIKKAPNENIKNLLENKTSLAFLTSAMFTALETQLKQKK